MTAPGGTGTTEVDDVALSAEAEAALDRDASHPTDVVVAFEERSGWDRLLGLGSPGSLLTPWRLVLLVLAIGFILLLAFNQDQLDGVALGIGSGALIAGLALSIVVTYRGSGVVNFAAGAIAMYAGYVFNGLRNGGQFIIIPLPNPFAPIEGIAHDLGDHSLRLPHWPVFASVGGHWGLWPALLMTLFLSAVVGLLIHVCIFMPLRHAPALAKVVASIGLLIVIQSIIVLRFTATAQNFNALLPSTGWHLPDNVTLPADEPILLGIVIVIAFALFATYRWTKFGLRTRAAAENEKGAVLRGFSPDALAGTNWMLSTALAAGIGILAASIDQSLDPTTITLLVIPAIAAALLGKFTSVSLTVVAGLAIGFIQAWIEVLSTQSWFPQVNGQALPGFQQIVPVLVIVGVLWFRGKHLPAREPRNHPPALCAQAGLGHPLGRHRARGRGGVPAHHGPDLAPGHHQLHRGRDHVPVLGHLDRVRGPDLLGPDGLRRGGGVLLVQARRQLRGGLPLGALDRHLGGDHRRRRRGHPRLARPGGEPRRGHLGGRGGHRGPGL